MIAACTGAGVFLHIAMRAPHKMQLAFVGAIIMLHLRSVVASAFLPQSRDGSLITVNALRHHT